MRHTWIPLCLMAALAADAGPAGAPPVQASIGPPWVALNGPWRFHTGDDPRWAAPELDDSGWETVDLTPPPGSHDADVGLTGYVPGWGARGHRGYWGYAWYRMKVRVTAPEGEPLSLAGPPAVDDAYRIFVDGRLLGGLGFPNGKPGTYGNQPRIFPLGTFGPIGTAGGRLIVLAVRVWMSEVEAGVSDAGGIHIAPALGAASGIDALYRLQWLETFRGYIVDVVEPVVFLMLAAMAWRLAPSDAKRWMTAALVLTAAVRAHQAVFAWTQWDSLPAFDAARNAILSPLALGAWAMAWYAWFRLRRLHSLPRAIAVLTPIYMASQAFGGAEFFFLPHAIRTGAGAVSVALRLSFALAIGADVCFGAGRRRGSRWLAPAAVVLISVGLFADELTAAGIPGIWFPFGTGVSRTQFAYAAFDAVMFVLLLRAPRARDGEPAAAATNGHGDWRSHIPLI